VKQELDSLLNRRQKKLKARTTDVIHYPVVEVVTIWAHYCSGIGESNATASLTYTHLLRRHAGRHISHTGSIRTLDQSLPHKRHQQPKLLRRGSPPTRGSSSNVPKTLARETLSALARSSSRAAAASSAAHLMLRVAHWQVPQLGDRRPAPVGAYGAHQLSSPHSHAGPPAVVKQQPSPSPEYVRTPPTPSRPHQTRVCAPRLQTAAEGVYESRTRAGRMKWRST